MRPTASLLQVALCLSSFAPLTAAWPGWLPDKRTIVVVRADDGDNKSDATPPPSSSLPPNTGSKSAQQTPPPSTDGGNNGKSTSGSGSSKGTQTGSSSDKGKGKSTSSKKDHKHTTFAADLPAGGVSMTMPNTMIEPTPLVKISEMYTFGWNYTSLLGTPTAVDVLLSCSTATATWTLTANMTFQTSVTYKWNTSVQANDPNRPLLTEMYTLIIKDSDSAITDTPEAGYLGAYSGFKFGMYQKQPYVDLDEWHCPGGCGGASPSFSRDALGLAITMSVLTLFSFTWFVSGLGLI